VEAMLVFSPYPSDHELGLVPPRYGVASIRNLAINAVMAGCKPEYFPVALAAIEALLDPTWNLNGIQATTHCCAPLVIVGGPVVERIGMNSGHNCFGNGNRANATIGRMLRLVMINLGGGYPGSADMSTFGHPGKYGYCIAESTEHNPWSLLHEDFGCPKGSSGVTVFAGEAPHQVNDHVHRDPKGILTSIADTMSAMGSNNVWMKAQMVIVLSPEHAAPIAKAQWTKDDVRYYLFEQARRKVSDLKKGGRWAPETLKYWPKWNDVDNDENMVPIMTRPEEILVCVAGGTAGKFSMVIPGWTQGTRATTRAVSS
jgi:hypothetical protein